MSNFVEPEIAEQIRARAARGESLRMIARETGADKNTVMAHRRTLLEELRVEGQRPPIPAADPLQKRQDWHCETCLGLTHGKRCEAACIRAPTPPCTACGGPRSWNSQSGKCWACWKTEQEAIWAANRGKPKVRATREDYFAGRPPVTAEDARKVASRLIGTERYWGGVRFNDRIHWDERDKHILAAFCMAGADAEKSAVALGRSAKAIAWRARDTRVPMPKSWAALIAPPRAKSTGGLIQLAYPYIAKRRDSHADLLGVNDLVPKDVPGWIRADVCQNILLAILEGETTLDELRRAPATRAHFVGKFMKATRDNMLVSIEGIGDDDRSYEDIAASRSDDWRYGEEGDARRLRDGMHTHTAATQMDDIDESLQRERQKAWHARGIYLSPSEMDDIYHKLSTDRQDHGRALELRLQSMTRRDVLYERQHGRCAYCEGEMTLRWGFPTTVTRDHVIARSDGGSDDDANLVGACMECNWRKGSMPVADFLKAIGRTVNRRARF